MISCLNEDLMVKSAKTGDFRMDLESKRLLRDDWLFKGNFNHQL